MRTGKTVVGIFSRVGENRELVGAAIAIRVFADLDPVFAILVRVVTENIRVVDALDHPQSASGVKGHRERLDEIRLGREQLDVESFWHVHMAHRIRRRQRLGHPFEPVPFGSPFLSGDVVRKAFARFDELCRGQVIVGSARGPAHRRGE